MLKHQGPAPPPHPRSHLSLPPQPRGFLAPLRSQSPLLKVAGCLAWGAASWGKAWGLGARTVGSSQWLRIHNPETEDSDGGDGSRRGVQRDHCVLPLRTAPASGRCVPHAPTCSPKTPALRPAPHRPLHRVPRHGCVSPLGQVTRIPPVLTVPRALAGLPLPQRRGEPSWWPPSGVAEPREALGLHGCGRQGRVPTLRGCPSQLRDRGLGTSRGNVPGTRRRGCMEATKVGRSPCIVLDLQTKGTAVF